MRLIDVGDINEVHYNYGYTNGGNRMMVTYIELKLKLGNTGEGNSDEGNTNEGDTS